MYVSYFILFFFRVYILTRTFLLPIACMKFACVLHACRLVSKLALRPIHPLHQPHACTSAEQNKKDRWVRRGRPPLPLVLSVAILPRRMYMHSFIASAFNGLCVCTCFTCTYIHAAYAVCIILVGHELGVALGAADDGANTYMLLMDGCIYVCIYVLPSFDAEGMDGMAWPGSGVRGMG